MPRAQGDSVPGGGTAGTGALRGNGWVCATESREAEVTGTESPAGKGQELGRELGPDEQSVGPQEGRERGSLGMEATDFAGAAGRHALTLVFAILPPVPSFSGLRSPVSLSTPVPAIGPRRRCLTKTSG